MVNDKYYGKKSDIKKVTALYISKDLSLAYAKAGQIDVAYAMPVFASQEIYNMKLVNLPAIYNRGLTMPLLKNTGKKNAAGLYNRK